MQHDQACASIFEHVEKVHWQEIKPSRGIPDLDDLARRELDNFRAEQLRIDPTFRAVAERVRAQMIAQQANDDFLDRYLPHEPIGRLSQGMDDADDWDDPE